MSRKRMKKKMAWRVHHHEGEYTPQDIKKLNDSGWIVSDAALVISIDVTNHMTQIKARHYGGTNETRDKIDDVTGYEIALSILDAGFIESPHIPENERELIQDLLESARMRTLQYMPVANAYKL